MHIPNLAAILLLRIYPKVKIIQTGGAGSIECSSQHVANCIAQNTVRPHGGGYTSHLTNVSLAMWFALANEM